MTLLIILAIIVAIFSFGFAYGKIRTMEKRLIAVSRAAVDASALIQAFQEVEAMSGAKDMHLISKAQGNLRFIIALLGGAPKRVKV